ncbi:MAG: hypothetical protein QOE61_5564 [Micromonosporaceae bacterium]|jgi:hypothetical protein|nr:hypothetical protein [Micromonosporaceae bacterium]
MLSALAAGLAALVAMVLAMASTDTPVRHPIKPAACVRANIDGHIVCLAARQPCRHRYEASYRFYGLTCARDRRGRLALKQRMYIGRPLALQPGSRLR